MGNFQKKADDLGVPVIPPLPKRAGPIHNPIIAICGECGLELHQTMMYCCHRNNCPSGLGGSMS